MYTVKYENRELYSIYTPAGDFLCYVSSALEAERLLAELNRKI